MNEQELKDLIRAVLADILAPKKALVLFTGALLGFDDALASLADLKQCGVQLEALQTDSAKQVLDQSKIAALGMPAPSQPWGAYKVLVIPTLSSNIAAKVAHGVADCMASNLVRGSILAGAKVVAAANGADPDCPDKKALYPNIPAGYAAMLKANLAALAGFGVSLCPAKELFCAVQDAYNPKPGRQVRNILHQPTPRHTTPRGRVIGNGYVHGLPEGSRLVLAPGDKITPAARESARIRNIEIV
jgi:hypothetical protein